MPIYIKGTGNISPQQTWGNLVLQQPVSYNTSRLTSIEPDYSSWIAPIQLRRMSRIIKMGIGAAQMAMTEAGVTHPDGIITGTGFGCLYDTGQFLSQLVTNREEGLNPTPFIQSTHNTIGSQIALLLQIREYNQTYAHDAFSFESALLDAMLQLSDHPGQSILVGGIDEVTDISHRIHSRFGLYRATPQDSLSLFTSKARGTLQGEGSAWFVLTGNRTVEKVSIEGLTTLYKPERTELEEGIQRFLGEQGLQPKDIDVLLLGKSGDEGGDAVMETVSENWFGTSTVAAYKHLCGEYPVAISFAVWLAAEILKTQQVPPIVTLTNRNRKAKTVLIYNQYFGTHHSLIVLKAC